MRGLGSLGPLGCSKSTWQRTLQCAGRWAGKGSGAERATPTAARTGCAPGYIAPANDGGTVVRPIKNVPGKLVIAAATAMAVAASLAQNLCPAGTQPSGEQPDLAAALNQAAEGLMIKDAVEICAHRIEPIVTWTVYFDADAVSPLIGQAVSAPTGRVFQWKLDESRPHACVHIQGESMHSRRQCAGRAEPRRPAACSKRVPQRPDNGDHLSRENNVERPGTSAALRYWRFRRSCSCRVSSMRRSSLSRQTHLPWTGPF
jgi:hypothetical protein